MGAYAGGATIQVAHVYCVTSSSTAAKLDAEKGNCTQVVVEPTGLTGGTDREKSEQPRATTNQRFPVLLEHPDTRTRASAFGKKSKEYGRHGGLGRYLCEPPQGRCSARPRAETKDGKPVRKLATVTDGMKYGVD